jgi:hypothetical protein
VHGICLFPLLLLKVDVEYYMWADLHAQPLRSEVVVIDHTLLLTYTLLSSITHCVSLFIQIQVFVNLPTYWCMARLLGAHAQGPCYTLRIVISLFLAPSLTVH